MGATKLPLFTQHARLWRENRYVYPVLSRRSQGLSIGVNLNPDKACNFDCVYCCVDRTQPPVNREVNLSVVEEELEQMLLWVKEGGIWVESPFEQTPVELRRLNDVAFSGDGEPTASREFFAACRLTGHLLEKHGLAQETRIVVITNATLLNRRAVREALDWLDQHNGEIWAKLDAGTDNYYRTIERTGIPLRRVLANISEAGQRRELVIQSLFLCLAGEEPPGGEIDAYLQRLKELRAAGCRIRQVQVYTVARRPAETQVTALPDDALDRIAERVRRETGLSASVYYGVG